MDDRARDELRRMVAVYGQGLVRDPRRCAALLKDILPDAKLEARLLIDALEEGTAATLLDTSESVPPELIMNRLVVDLQRDRGLSPDNARWAVESWALALGVGVRKPVVVGAGEGGRGTLDRPGVGDVVTEPTPETPTESERTGPEPKPPSRRWLVFAGVGVVVVVGAVVGVLLSRHSVPSPGDVQATAANGGKVTVSWSGPSNKSFVVYRDGTRLGSTSSEEFQDLTVKPDTPYVYSVEAVDASGHHSKQVEASVMTPAAPLLSQATVDGKWTISGTFTDSSYRGISSGDPFTDTWTIDCGSGSCTSFQLTAAPHGDYPVTTANLGTGGNWTAFGHRTYYDGTNCGNATAQFSFDILVTRASFVEGVWTADAIAGTIKDQSSYDYCADAGDAISVTGTRA